MGIIFKAGNTNVFTIGKEVISAWDRHICAGLMTFSCEKLHKATFAQGRGARRRNPGRADFDDDRGDAPPVPAHATASDAQPLCRRGRLPHAAGPRAIRRRAPVFARRHVLARGPASAPVAGAAAPRPGRTVVRAALPADRVPERRRGVALRGARAARRRSRRGAGGAGPVPARGRALWPDQGDRPDGAGAGARVARGRASRAGNADRDQLLVAVDHRRRDAGRDRTGPRTRACRPRTARDRGDGDRRDLRHGACTRFLRRRA